ncbi:hypothetical protein JCM3774_005196 [Rhodotorula dairenensis]
MTKQSVEATSTVSPTPNLAALPQDVKLWFVEIVAARSWSSLVSLSAVNKEWNAFADVHLWSAVHLTPAATSTLEFLAFELMPRIGKHVHDLEIERWVHCVKFQCEDAPRPPPPATAEEIKRLERVLGLPGPPAARALAWNHRIARVQNALLARILRSCVALKTIMVRGGLSVRTYDDYKESFSDLVPPRLVPNLVYPALKQIGQTVEDVHLDMGPGVGDDAIPIAEMGQILENFPNCRYLRLCFEDLKSKHWNPSNKRKLMWTLSYLSKLEALTFTRCTAIGKMLDYEDISLPASLSELGIHCAALSVDMIRKIGDRYGTQLTKLGVGDLDQPLHVARADTTDQPAAHAMQFPVLDTLLLTTQFDLGFLKLFGDSPLRYVILDHGPRRDQVTVLRYFTVVRLAPPGRDPSVAAISASDLLQVLEAHKSTLEVVRVHEHVLTAADVEVERLESWLGLNGIDGGVYGDACSGHHHH